MASDSSSEVLVVSQRIVRIRDRHVMLDVDLAALYGVTTKALLQAVRRNSNRFPDDFVIQINEVEWENLRSQFVTSSGWGGRRYRPWAFSEHGALQLANVPRSERAVAVSLVVVRAFVRLRQWAGENRELAERIAELERGHGHHDVAIENILATLRQLLSVPAPAR